VVQRRRPLSNNKHVGIKCKHHRPWNKKGAKNGERTKKKKNPKEGFRIQSGTDINLTESALTVTAPAISQRRAAKKD